MQIYWNKRKRLHKKSVQLPEDWFGTPTWPPFHCFGTPIWPPWRHVKTLYRNNWKAFWGQWKIQRGQIKPDITISSIKILRVDFAQVSCVWNLFTTSSPFCHERKMDFTTFIKWYLNNNFSWEIAKYVPLHFAYQQKMLALILLLIVYFHVSLVLLLAWSLINRLGLDQLMFCW